MDSLGIDLTSDKRQPRSPGRRPSRTPQQWIADLDLTLRLDSVVVRNGEVVYREQAAGRARPGVMTFADIQATAVNVSHRVDRRTGSDTMSLATTARLQNAAPLDVQFAIPLDAPRFDMTFRGTLGAMSGRRSEPVRRGGLPAADRRRSGHGDQLQGGGERRGRAWLDHAALHRPVGLGDAPRLGGNPGRRRDLRRSRAGHRLDDGELAGAREQPRRPTKPPLSGRIHYVFRPDQTLPAFLWAGVAGGLLQVVRQ